MWFLWAIFLNLGAQAADGDIKAKLHLDLKKDCTWTRQPGKEGMPVYPTFESDHVPGCFLHCYDIFEIYVDVLDQVRYTDTGNKGLSKMCDVPGKPPTSYLCGANVFTCAITGDKDEEGKDKPDPRMVAFPQSCVAESWGAANKVGAGTVPNGKASLALYAYSNYETKGSVKGSRRIIAYQVRFEDVDDAYDGMCQGTLELEPGETIFGVHAGEGLTREDAVAPLALPGVQPGIWPTPPFHPTPKEKPKTRATKIDDKGKDKNGEGSKVTARAIYDKDEDKIGVEGSRVPWVPLIAGLVLLSVASSAFLIRRSRRVPQFADSA